MKYKLPKPDLGKPLGESYLESCNVYDAYAEYYEEVGDKKNAIEYFKLALPEKEFPETRKNYNTCCNKNYQCIPISLYAGKAGKSMNYCCLFL